MLLAAHLDFLKKISHHLPHLLGKIRHSLFLHPFGNIPDSFGDTANYSTQRICISTKADSTMNGIFKGMALSDNSKSHRYCPLASFIKAVLDLIDIDIQIVV